MTVSKRVRRAGVLALTAVLLTSACGLGGASHDTGPGNGLEKSEIWLTGPLAIDAVPAWGAIEAGYFEAEGLKVHWVTAATPADALNKVIGGHDADICFTTDPPVILAKHGKPGGIDVMFVADASYASPNSNLIVATPNSPVKNVRDLAGKKIAVSTLSSTSGLLTRSIMADETVDYSHVHWLEMPLPNMAAAMQHGDVDAAYLPEPWVSQAAKQVGAAPIIDVSQASTREFPLTAYAATRDFVTKHPRTVAAFQRAMFNMTRIASNHVILEPWLVKYAKIDADAAKLVTLPNFSSQLTADRLQRVSDKMAALGDLEAQGTFNGHIKGPDTSDMIAAQYAG